MIDMVGTTVRDTDDRIVALLTCHNRRASTLQAVERLYAQRGADYDLDIMVLDAGSTDGTTEALGASFPDVRVIVGGADLFWNSGMRHIFLVAAQEGYSFYLWVNDDTYLDDTAVSHLLTTHRSLSAVNPQEPALVVGATRDTGSPEVTYGGVRRTSRIRPLSFSRLDATGEPVRCDTLNGNCALIPHAVVERIGVLDGAFTHGLGDFDYGLRATAAGCGVWVAAGTVGTCARWERPVSQSVRAEWRQLSSPKGLPFGEWALFARRWGGPAWPIYAVSPWARRLGTALLAQVRRHVRPSETQVERADRAEDSATEERTTPDGTPGIRRRPQVAIVQAWVPDYRLPFHEELRLALDRRGIDLLLVHGYPHGDAVSKSDGVTVPFAHVCDHKVFRAGRTELTWQPCLRLVRSADMVIGDQASKRLSNYALWLRHLTGRQRFALWGLGRNFYADEASAVGEALKRIMSRRVHWWFAYNDMSADIVRNLGFPPERITSVNNAIDTRELSTYRDQFLQTGLEGFRTQFGVRTKNVAVHLSSLHRQKLIPYVLEAAEAVRARVPDFELLVVGTGPLAGLVEEAARRHDWIRYVGRRTGVEKAAAMALAKVMFMPGNVGLAVLDSFAMGVPLISLADSHHGPEMSYLQSGRNGLLAPAGTGPRGYAALVAELLSDDERRLRLQQGALQSAQQYTIQHMVERFADGVERALAAERRR